MSDQLLVWNRDADGRVTITGEPPLTPEKIEALFGDDLRRERWRQEALAQQTADILRALARHGKGSG